MSVEAALKAIAHTAGQFNVLHPDSGSKIDFMIVRKDAWGREQLSRRQPLKLLPGPTAFAARPEDVILGKLLCYKEGGSEKHTRDICGILKRNGTNIDRDYIARWAVVLDVSDVWAAAEGHCPAPRDKS